MMMGIKIGGWNYAAAGIFLPALEARRRLFRRLGQRPEWFMRLMPWNHIQFIWANHGGKATNETVIRIVPYWPFRWLICLWLDLLWPIIWGFNRPFPALVSRPGIRFNVRPVQL